MYLLFLLLTTHYHSAHTQADASTHYHTAQTQADAAYAGGCLFLLTTHYHTAQTQADASLRMRSTLAGAQSASHVDTKESASVSAKVFYFILFYFIV